MSIKSINAFAASKSGTIYSWRTRDVRLVSLWPSATQTFSPCTVYPPSLTESKRLGTTAVRNRLPRPSFINHPSVAVLDLTAQTTSGHHGDSRCNVARHLSEAHRGHAVSDTLPDLPQAVLRALLIIMWPHVLLFMSGELARRVSRSTAQQELSGLSNNNHNGAMSQLHATRSSAHVLQ